MEQFKMQAANEVGVDLKNGYNGELTSRQAGSIGGQMVNPIRTVRYIRSDRTAFGHAVEVGYVVDEVM